MTIDVQSWIDALDSIAVDDLWGDIPGIRRSAGYVGKEIKDIWIDEAISLFPKIFGTDNKYPPVAIETYYDERYSEATVMIFSEREDIHDPRNPNPKAPPRWVYCITTDKGGSPERFHSLPKAQKRAEALHKKLVKGFVEQNRIENQVDSPLFGRFA